MKNLNSLVLLPTDDGSYTFFSKEYNEAFHSNSGAKQEAEKKFIQSCRIFSKAQEQSSLKLLDICYGLGYNSAAALDTIWAINPNCYIELIALEIDEQVPQNAIAQGLLNNWAFPIPEILTKLAQDKQIETSNLQAKLWINDARQSITQLCEEHFLADAIFLDPFSPTKCPQLWTVEFISFVSKCLKSTGYLATYSCAASIRTALQIAGLSIGATESVGRRSPGTIASWSQEHLSPLSEQEKEHLQTRAAIPYRDPSLKDSSVNIQNRRAIEQKASNLESTSQWKKRWENFRKKTELL
ncbi:hypothetical protein C7H19_04505 [Aphanothece hegewaldii CCALA 016]|uniref:MnmC-like methyltransferase domain-containing protein n=1 Tax=Aphanothece hegewaldii CCALA 016 TaxID=2107694 RepID=A0A2T1M219_9CHRO|nr:MnmC family methyltransferase [Aphanothece hegewaldii]PSF38766.1 hypothetical protein C7H19_04505 [Aphanothece hegewaldii CCALA 016]